MTERGYALTVTAPPIEALIIQPDGSYEVRQVSQDLATFRGILQGYLEAVSGEGTTFWCNEEGKLRGFDYNPMATHLWWMLCPEMEGLDTLVGPIIVTGPADEAGDSTPILPAALNAFRQLVALRMAKDYRDPDSQGKPSP